MLKQVFTAFTLIGAGIGAGRTLLSNEVDRRTQKVIDSGAVEARQRIRHSAYSYLQKTWIKFAIVTLVKVVVLGMLTGAFFLDFLSHSATLALFAIVLSGFLIRDSIVIFPSARFAVAEVRKHGFKPHTILKELVAATVYQDVLEQADALKTSRVETLLISLSGQSRDGITKKIADQVSSIAAQTTWQDIRPFVTTTAVMFVVLTLIYSAALMLLLAAV